MNEKFDNDLNDYIDGNLNNNEFEKLNQRILTDAEALEKLKSLRTVHGILNDLEISEAPANFTNTVMQKIVDKPNSVTETNNNFFKIILFIFTLSITAFSGYAAYLSFSLTEESKSIMILKNMSVKFNEYLTVINSQIISNTSIVVVSTFALIIIFSFYFIVSSHDDFLKKINNFV